MPTAPGSRCTEPGCGTITTRGRCDQHQRKPWANTSARNQTIDKAAWIKVKRRHLTQYPACVDCGGTEALEVDHIIEVTDGGSLLDPSNLATRCHQCHKAKTRLQRAHRAAQRQFPTA
jgi:5-methylcytosine-specific restriction enzyme A